MQFHSYPVPVRLLLVGQSSLLRDSLTVFLAATEHLQVIGQVDSAVEHLFFIKASPPDVILVDVDLPDGPNVPLVTALRTLFPSVPLVVLTACTQSGPLQPLLALKLRGYLSKAGSSSQELVNALFAAATPDGATIIAASFMHLLAASQPVEDDFGQRQATLTPQEKIIFDLILAGKSNKEIAQQLYIKPQTVRNHSQAIYEKFGVNSRVKLLLLVNRAKSD